MADINLAFKGGNRKLGDYYYRIGKITQEDKELNTRALEVLSSEATGAEDTLYFSDLTVVLLYMITKEEYAWAEEDPEKLDKLVLELMEKLPKDRLLGGSYLGLSGNNRMPFQPNGKCETMDDYKIRYAYSDLPFNLQEWETREEVWVMVNARLNVPFPAIDMNGSVNIFISQELGKQEVARFGEDFKLLPVKGKDIAQVLKSYFHMGIQKIAIRNDAGNRVVELKDLLNENETFAGTEIQAAMIRFLQTIRSTKAGDSNYQKTATLWWNLICKEIVNNIFIVPVIFEGESLKEAIEDNVVHAFPLVQGKNVDINEKGQLMFNDKVVYGSEGVTFPEKVSKAKMHIRTSYNPGMKQEWLGIFTDVYEFNKIWKGKAHIGLATFNDFCKSFAPAKGIVINPANQCLFLEAATIAALEKAQGK